MYMIPYLLINKVHSIEQLKAELRWYRLYCHSETLHHELESMWFGWGKCDALLKVVE